MDEDFNKSKVPGFKATLFHFKVMFSGWECDEDAWVVELEDGSRVIVTTSHGGTYVAKPDEFTKKLAEYERVAADTRKALDLADKHRPIFMIEGELADASQLGEPARTNVSKRLNAELLAAKVGA